MKYIEEIDVNNKNVILRLDLNVTIKDGMIVDDTKIKKSIPTIKYLLNHNAKVLIMSHLGKVKKEEDKPNNSLRIVASSLSSLLDTPVVFIPETKGALLENAFANSLSLMENTRYEDVPNNLESGCNDDIASYWASLGDVFINDAFGTTHRQHASNYGISKHLPSAYGFLIAEELKGLSPIIDNINRPFTVIMGGAKVDDKVALIESLLERCDNLLVGGGIANTFLKASNLDVGESLYSSEYVEKVAELIKKYHDKIYIPSDVVISVDDQSETRSVDDIPEKAAIYDIGPKTIETYSEILQLSSTIFVNGTMGMYENSLYCKGTESLYKAMNELDAIIIAGGGDAVASVNKLGYQQVFDFMSTGGGASLEYIATKQITAFARDK